MPEPLTFGGIPLVYDPMVPVACAYIVRPPPAHPGESYFAYKRRMLRMGVKLINIGGDRG